MSLLSIKSIGISEKIIKSDIFSSDNHLKKDLILVIQVSQRAKTVRAWKFFTLKLSGFTAVRKIFSEEFFSNFSICRLFAQPFHI